jgi:hypothetical protein
LDQLGVQVDFGINSPQDGREQILGVGIFEATFASLRDYLKDAMNLSKLGVVGQRDKYELTLVIAVL